MGFSMQGNMLPVFLVLSSFYLSFSTALELIKDPETISSNDDAFKLGFFSPANTTNRYVGIWYLSDSNIIWVANRDQPVQDSSGVVTISENNNLEVLNGKKEVVWSSNVSNIIASNSSTAQLQNNGNLILQDNSTGNTIWESFKHPSDTFTPDLTITSNQITGERDRAISWKSASDPAIGNFSCSLERLDAPEMIVWNQTRPIWRSGPWNGQIFIGLASNLLQSYLSGFSIERKENGIVQITYILPNNTFFGTIVVSPEGQLVYNAWRNRVRVGKRAFQQSNCDVYGFCGPNGSCDLKNSLICTCLTGFEPRKVDEWNGQNWESGCVRREALQCERVKNGSEAGNKDVFLKLQNTKVPDFAEQSYMSVEACRSECLENCSCKAYAFDDGIGCMRWSRELIDIVRYSTGGADVYLRQAYSAHDDKKRNIAAVIIATVIVGAIVVVGACTYFLWSWKRSAARKQNEGSLVLNSVETHPENQVVNPTGDVEQVKIKDLPLFDFQCIADATSNFDIANKLGQGGFGSVYKGELQDGLEIAVKRLSRVSEQGLEEFMNEVILISKLQHRNLVKLIGCCVEGEEKVLIYEYLPNKSLDFYLFDPIKKKVLDWGIRSDIIEGISRGLLYLHRDSRLRIIHRDLKPSNILLDGEMNAKISDFGMARIFGSSENEANTKRIVGTYGYMSPEYAMEGLFSEKSDVFAFGVLMLEIISGRKNTSFYKHEHSLSFLGYAWKLWNEEDMVSLIDPEIYDPDYESHILRCIHIGLLCVQEFTKERPTMATVVSMLTSEIVHLPHPCQPAFIKLRQSHDESNSINEVSVTNLQGR